MLKIVLYSVLLFILFYVTVIESAKTAPKTAPPKNSAPKKKKPEDDKKAALLKACYTNCDSMPAKTNAKVGTYLCYQICDKNHPQGKTFGCQDKWCWSDCSGSGFGIEWCWTTKTHSQSYDYASCTKDSDCQSTWHCGGPCTVFGSHPE